MKRAIWILWPSFLVAAAATGVFFSIFDPADLGALSPWLPPQRLGAYTLGFFAFWLLGSSSSALTCFLQRSADEVNRRSCPLPDERRPAGCRSR